MEGVTEGVNNLNIEDDGGPKRNRVQVSNTKRPLFFYVNLSKRYLQQYNEVELSALGMAIHSVVTVAEILKNNGFAIEKSIKTLTIDMRDNPEARPIPKAKIEIVLVKSDKFDEMIAEETERRREIGDDDHEET